MGDRRYVDDLSIEELERALLMKRRQARSERIRRLARGRPLGEELIASMEDLEEPAPFPIGQPARREDSRFRPLAAEKQKSATVKTRRLRINLAWVRDSALLILEVLALLGLVIILLASVFNMQTMTQDVALARGPTPTVAPTPQVQIKLSVLPGAHSPPTTIGSVPQRLADMVQPVVPVPIPTPGPQSPTRIVIKSIGVDAPVVQGDDWEQLKKGATHHIGSANPGERGNCFISAHNDIFGMIFQHLDKVELENEIVVYAGERAYRYVVKAKRIVEPTDTSVMAQTASPILTLMTCYPFMIDTHRMVVIAELAN